MELCVLVCSFYCACLRVIFAKVRMCSRLFSLLHAHCIFLLNLACWVGHHSKMQCAVLQLGRERYWTKLMCISISKPTHCRSLWLDNIILLPVFYKNSLHGLRYPIQDDHSLELASARQYLTGNKTIKVITCFEANDVIIESAFDNL